DWLSPKKLASTPAPAALIVLWAPGYEGSAGVLPASGSQLGSATVSGLPAVSAGRVAGPGRQSWEVDLGAVRAIAASAKLRLRAAKSRAVVGRSLWWVSATVWAIWFQKFWTGGLQNLPISVCSGVRVVLVAEPTCCTSPIASAQASLVSGCGGA